MDVKQFENAIPGPWHTVEHSWEEISVYDKDGRVCTLRIDSELCDEENVDSFEAQMKDTAALIAAAPALLAERQALREALTELLEAETAVYPPATEGQDAQTAWVHRQCNARDAARELLAKGAA